MSSCEREELEKKIYTQFESEIKAAGGNRVKIEWVKELPKDGWRKFLGKIRGMSVWLFKHPFKIAEICVLLLVGMPQAVKNYEVYFPESYNAIAEVGKGIRYVLQYENPEVEQPTIMPNIRFALYVNKLINEEYSDNEYEVNPHGHNFRYQTVVGGTVSTHIGEAHLTTMYRYSKADKGYFAWDKQRPAGVAITSGTCVSTVTTYNLLA